MSKDWVGNFHSVVGCLGASSHTSSEREINDYYATDPIAAEWLCKIENLDHHIWECACGEGHLSKVFEREGYEVRSTDLIDRGYGEGGIDFLMYYDEWDGDIVTNPPYKYAQEFIEHALDLVQEGHKVCMFLKVQFLEGKNRRMLFTHTPPEQYGFHHPVFDAVRTASLKILWSRMLGMYGKKDIPAIRL